MQLIEENEEYADFEGLKPDNLIEKAEKRLACTFPPTYRMFLSQLGCGDIEGLEFFGVIQDNFDDSGIPDAVWLTLNLRQTEDLPNHLVVISETGTGEYYALELSRVNESDECPVVLWSGWESDPVNREWVAADFGDFFYSRVTETLEDL